MWNQGNGNGQGNGYPQQQGYGNPNDVYDRLNNARQVSNRDPYIDPGTHTLAVISLEEFNSEMGAAVRGVFLVLDSTSMRPGTKCGAVWFLQKPTPKPGMVSDSDRFADFCCRLKGAPQGYAIGADIRTLLRDRAAEQLARGMVIRAVGINKTAKTTGKTFCVVNWSNLEQTPQQIAEMRQKIESTPGLVEQQRGTQGGQFQGTPHPSQMQNQYPAQNVQPQGGYPNPQNGYPQQPQVAQAPQGVPPGGFLANVPPQGNNNGGGSSW